MRTIIIFAGALALALAASAETMFTGEGLTRTALGGVVVQRHGSVSFEAVEKSNWRQVWVGCADADAVNYVLLSMDYGELKALREKIDAAIFFTSQQ